MKINLFLFSNLYISHSNTFLSEYIGYVFSLLSSSYNYNKFFVIKKNNSDLMLLSNDIFFFLFNAYSKKLHMNWYKLRFFFILAFIITFMFSHKNRYTFFSK